MASTSETGHNKNIANFNTVYQILEEMGALYSPTNSKIKLSNLDPIRNSLQTVITELNAKQPVYKNAVAARETAIEPLGKLMTKALNYAKSLDISVTDKENIAAQAKKIRGDQKAKKVSAVTTTVESISTSQMSYDNRIANLRAFTDQLESYAKYSPNEAEIQITHLKAFHSNLTNLSNTVNVAGNALITARKNRDEILYKNSINVIQLVKDIKAYLKSLGETGKPYYNAVVKLKFTES
ncbi:hypothetical protein [Chryseobacterium limigenitum]|uniref:Uncharacterized protein n=1 Tax=Chryseobacterium limigenitum TaxID=1612149 RepID=A0A1K2IHQ8_9FLAO|nr:hypothetical protein [Chryseobacterium limigenitum]SFZ91972.1 hypothetical protein SAMN05216324_10357 [Chryseobacterium limigenitum]